MASVRLRALWLNDATDGSDRICLRYVGSLSRTPAVAGSVVRLAGGRMRSVAQAGQATQWKADVSRADAGQAAWLAAHTGTPVWVRDPWGAKVLGVYWAVDVSPRLFDANMSVSFTLDEVTV